MDYFYLSLNKLSTCLIQSWIGNNVIFVFKVPLFVILTDLYSKSFSFISILHLKTQIYCAFYGKTEVQKNT